MSPNIHTVGTVCVGRGRKRTLGPLSFHVLHLLLDAVDIALHLDDLPTYLHVQTLAGDRVRLAEHLLRQEVQRLKKQLDNKKRSKTTDPADNDSAIAWTRAAWADMKPFSRGGVYLNFPGQGEEGETLLRASYGDANFERLVEVKTKYDPENFFRLNQNIQPKPPRGA